MDSHEFSELCRDLSLLLNVENIEALSETGAFVEGEKVGVIFGEDLFDGVHVYVDVGHFEDSHPSEDVFREILDLNLELSAKQGESFGLFGETGSLVLRSFFRNEEASARQLADRILRHVKLVQELRAGPLSGVTKPPPT
jgi:hypothetical protein